MNIPEITFDPGLMMWFEKEGMIRRSIIAEDPDHIVEIVRIPMIALGKFDMDFRNCPNPDKLEYPRKKLADMSFQDFQGFISNWFEMAVSKGFIRCFACNEVLSSDPEHPWDPLFFNEELVCWFAVHFDCKRNVSKELKWRLPYDLDPTEAEYFDMSKL